MVKISYEVVEFFFGVLAGCQSGLRHGYFSIIPSKADWQDFEQLFCNAVFFEVFACLVTLRLVYDFRTTTPNLGAHGRGGPAGFLSLGGAVRSFIVVR